MRYDAYVAEIIEDRRNAPGALVHCVIQRQGSPEILFYTQFNTVEAATTWAEEELRIYAKEQRGKAEEGQRGA